MGITNKLLKKYHDNVVIKSPNELLKICKNNTDKYHFLICCFCKYKAGKIVDNLIDIAIKKLHRIERKGLSKAKEDLWDIEENEQVLYESLVDISLEKPEGVIKEAIYPVVGGKSKLERAKQLRELGKIKKKSLEYESFRRLYIQNRKYLLNILGQSDLRSNAKNNIFKAAQYITEQWQEGNEADYFEKQVIVMNAILAPQDYEERRGHYLDILGLDLSGEKQLDKTKRQLVDAIIELNRTIQDNTKVRIGKKGNKPHIFITPSEEQEEPKNIPILKQKVLEKWGYISLLDILKEADLRIGLTTEIIDATDKIVIEREVLQQRLLLCIYAAATNRPGTKDW